MSVTGLVSPPGGLSSHADQIPCRLCSDPSRIKVVYSEGGKEWLKCSSCGGTFLEPPTDPEFVATMLAEHYVTSESNLERRFEKSRDEVLSLVARRIQRTKTHGRILDVGCAGGYFLSRYFSSADWEKFGIEPSRFAAAKASEKGIRILQGQALSQDLPENYFDVVTILDALSYFREPCRELAVIRKALKPDGLLVIEQPLGSTHVWRHSTKLGRRLGGRAMHLVDNGTFILYDASSVALLLRKTGFRPIETVQLPANRQSQGFRNAMFRLFYWGSQVLWGLSAHRLMLGPNFMVSASPLERTGEVEQ